MKVGTELGMALDRNHGSGPLLRGHKLKVAYILLDRIRFVVLMSVESAAPAGL